MSFLDEQRSKVQRESDKLQDHYNKKNTGEDEGYYEDDLASTELLRVFLMVQIHQAESLRLIASTLRNAA